MFKKGNNFDRVKQRFSLRKLNIGVCSVLLGLTFMSGNNNTVKAETTQNPTKLEESKATDQSQTGPTVVDASDNTNDAEFSNATNHINSGNLDNGGSDLSEEGIKQNNNGTETVNTAEIADQNYVNAAYEASLLGGNANPKSSHDSSDNNTEPNSRSTIIGLNEYSDPKHLGKVTEKLSDTARSIKQVNITPDELKPTLLDETGKAVENKSRKLNFDLNVYVHDAVSGVKNLDLNWQIDDRLSNQIDSISIDEGKGNKPVTFKKDTNSNVWRANFKDATQMTLVSGGVLNGHIQKTGAIIFKDSIFNVLKQADILNKNNEVDTNKDPLAYRSYVSYEGGKTVTGFVLGFVHDVYEPHSIIATTFNTTYFNTDKDNQIMAAEKNDGVSTADLNEDDGTHSFVGGYDDVYYNSTNNTIVVDNYLNRWDQRHNYKVKDWTYHYGVDPKLLPYIKSGEISRIDFGGGAIDSGVNYKSQVRALPDATDDNDSTYKNRNQLLLDQNGDGAFSGQEGTQYQKYASEHPSVWNNHGKVSSNLGNYYFGIRNSRPLVIRTIYHLKDKLSDGSKMSLTGLLREIGKTTTTPQLLFTNFMTDTDGKVVKGTESVSAPTFNQLSTPIAGPDQFTQTVNYVDGMGQTIASQNYVGKENTTQDLTVPQGWVLDGDTLPKTITIGTTNGSQNIKVKIDPQLLEDLQNNLRNANALNANTDTPKEADGALNQAITDGNKALKLLYGKDAPTNMQNTINELANTNDLVQALINGKNAESTAKYYNDTDDKQKALTDAMTAGKNAISSGITAQDQFEGAASAIEKAINGLSGKETDKTDLVAAINKGHNTQTDSSDYQDTSDAKRIQLGQDITDAETLNQDPKASQSNVDAAAKKISDDINNLNQGTDASKNKPVIPASKIPVGDNSQLNDDEKSQVKDNVEKSNSKGKVTNVDDHGNTTITYPDGSKNVVSGKDTTTGTSKDDLNKAINSGNDEKSGDSYTNTSNQNREDLDNAIKHGKDVAKDQHASQKDIDEAAQDINKAIDNVNNGQTDASKNKPVIPASKIPVGDNSQLNDDEKSQVKDNVEKSNSKGKVTNVDDHGNTTITYPDGSKNTISGDQVTTVIITGDDYTYDDYAYNDFYQVVIKANAVQVYTLPKGNLTKEKKLAHDTTLTVLETKKIDGQVWYRIGTNRWIMAATTIKVGELENFKLKRLSKKTKTTAIVWVNKLAIYNNVNGKMTKKHLTRGTKVRIYAIATINDGEWYKIGKNKWIPAAGVHELNDFYQVIIKANAVQVYTLPKGNLTKEKKLAHDTTLTVLETKKIDGQVWYRIGTNRWIMAATTIKVGELENFKLKRLSKKTKTTAIVWVNKLAIYNNVNGKMTKKHLTRGTKVRIYAIATINDGEWYKIGKNKWIPAAGVHELTVEPL